MLYVFDQKKQKRRLSKFLPEAPALTTHLRESLPLKKEQLLLRNKTN